MKMKSVILCNSPEQAAIVYPDSRRKILAELSDFWPKVITRKDFADNAKILSEVEAVFSTWGFWAFTPEELAAMPNLKHVFYAAGATDYFIQPFLQHNIAVYSAWQANAVPVAEYCLAQILLGCKGFFRNSRNFKDQSGAVRTNCGPGVYGETVALLGAGAISRKLQELLKAFSLNVLVIPSHPEKRTVSIEEAFKKAFVISNHLPNRSDNQRILTEKHFRSMREGAVFINTGRGTQVDEEALAQVMAERPDLTAILDVTDPEPPEPGSLLYQLDNVLLSAHIAGSLNDEVLRMTDFMIEEFQRVSAGKDALFRVSEDMLLTYTPVKA